MMLHYIVLIAVSNASQFAGIIHWISLVILSVFFSEVCIMQRFEQQHETIYLDIWLSTASIEVNESFDTDYKSIFAIKFSFLLTLPVFTGVK